MSDLGSNSETNTGGTYTAGNADFSGTASGTTNEDNGRTENPEGIEQSKDANTETVAIDTYLQEISNQNQAILSVNLVLVVAVFLSFGCLCVQTLIRSFEVRK